MSTQTTTHIIIDETTTTTVKPSLWKKVVKFFWAYTEKNSQADTKSFDGLL